jgi:hypothetical protein
LTVRTVSVPGFELGVSQQSPAKAQPGTVRAMDNMVPSLLYGATRRPGTSFVADLELSPNTQAKWTSFDRGDGDRYLIRLSAADIQVFDTNGLPIPVYGLDDTSTIDLTYLSARTNNENSNPEFKSFGTPPYTIPPNSSANNWATGPLAETAQVVDFSTLTASSLPDQASSGFAAISAIETNASGWFSATGASTYGAQEVLFGAVWLRKSEESSNDRNPGTLVCGFGLLGSSSGVVGVSIPRTDTDPTLPGLGFDLAAASIKSNDTSVITDAEAQAMVLDFGVEEGPDGWFRPWLVLDSSSYVDKLPGASGSGVRMGVVLKDGAGDTGRAEMLVWGAHVLSGQASFVPYFVLTNLRTIQAGNRMYVLNQGVVPRMTSKTSSGYNFLTFPEESAILWVKQGSFQTEYIFKLTLVSGESVNVVVETNNAGGTGGVVEPKSGLIAEQLATDIEAAFLAEGIAGTVVADSGIVRIMIADPQEVSEMTFTDSVGGQVTGLVYKKVKLIADLPEIAPHQWFIKIDGDEALDEDDWYAEFVANVVLDLGPDDPPPFPPLVQTGEIVAGEWVERTAPDILVEIDGQTMPHVLERRQDDAVGTVTGTPFGRYFAWGPETWKERLVGSDDTNALPSFIAQDDDSVPETIQSMFLVDGRLGFTSSNSIITSEVGDLTNFFRTTARTLKAGDRIDVDIGERTASTIKNNAVTQQQVLLFGDKSHFVLDAAGAFAPQTIRARTLFQLDVDSDTEPGRTERSIVVPYVQGRFSNIMEIVQVDVDRPFEPYPVTEQAQAYMLGRVLQIETSSTGEMQFYRMGNYEGLPSDRFNTIYCRNYRWRGPRLLQNAWHRWRFPSKYRTVHLAAFDDQLFLVFEGYEKTWLERMELDLDRLRSYPYQPILDCRLLGSDASVLFTTDGVLSQFELPVSIGETVDDIVAVYERAAPEPVGTELTTTPLSGDIVSWNPDTRVLTLRGDWSDRRDHFSVGRRVTSRIELQRPSDLIQSLTDGLQPRSSGFLQCKRLTLEYDRAGGFDIVIAPEKRPEYRTTFASNAVVSGHVGLLTDKIQTSAMGRSETIRASIESSSTLPFSLTSAEWLCQASRR